jgi:hypothetical protein
MVIKKRICTAAACGLLALAFESLSFGQKNADPSYLLSQLIKTSVAIDTDTLTPKKPYIVTVTIENISGREIDLKSICSFELLSLDKEAVARVHSVAGDSYWSPVNITTATPLRLDIIEPEMLKKGVVVGRVPDDVLHFALGEARTFKADLVRLFWNASMRNDWPRWNLFEVVPKGAYALRFSIESRGGHVNSNEVMTFVEQIVAGTRSSGMSSTAAWLPGCASENSGVRFLLTCER